MATDASIGCECNYDYCCPQCQAESEAELYHLRKLYEAEKAAGMLRSKEELDQELRDAGRGHLVKP